MDPTYQPLRTRVSPQLFGILALGRDAERTMPTLWMDARRAARSGLD
jgi:hypothetical protein